MREQRREEKREKRSGSSLCAQTVSPGAIMIDCAGAVDIYNNNKIPARWALHLCCCYYDCDYYGIEMFAPDARDKKKIASEITTI